MDTTLVLNRISDFDVPSVRIQETLMTPAEIAYTQRVEDAFSAVDITLVSRPENAEGEILSALYQMSQPDAWSDQDMRNILHPVAAALGQEVMQHDAAHDGQPFTLRMQYMKKDEIVSPETGDATTRFVLLPCASTTSPRANLAADQIAAVCGDWAQAANQNVLIFTAYPSYVQEQQLVDPEQELKALGEKQIRRLELIQIRMLAEAQAASMASLEGQIGLLTSLGSMIATYQQTASRFKAASTERDVALQPISQSIRRESRDLVKTLLINAAKMPDLSAKLLAGVAQIRATGVLAMAEKYAPKVNVVSRVIAAPRGQTGMASAHRTLSAALATRMPARSMLATAPITAMAAQIIPLVRNAARASNAQPGSVVASVLSSQPVSASAYGRSAVETRNVVSAPAAATTAAIVAASVADVKAGDRTAQAVVVKDTNNNTQNNLGVVPSAPSKELAEAHRQQSAAPVQALVVANVFVAEVVSNSFEARGANPAVINVAATVGMAASAAAGGDAAIISHTVTVPLAQANPAPKEYQPHVFVETRAGDSPPPAVNYRPEAVVNPALPPGITSLHDLPPTHVLPTVPTRETVTAQPENKNPPGPPQAIVPDSNNPLVIEQKLADDAKARIDQIAQKMEEIIKTDPDFLKNPEYMALNKEMNKQKEGLSVSEAFDLCKGKRCPCGLCKPIITSTLAAAGNLLTRPAKMLGQIFGISEPKIV